MGKIEALRPAAALPVRSAEREALAAAIARHAVAAEAVARVEEARGKAAAMRDAAERAAGQAQGAIDDAATKAPSRLIERLLSGDGAASAGDPIAAAEEALKRAEADERVAAEAVRLLDEQITPARQHARLAELNRDRCIIAVAQAEAMAALITKWDSVNREAARLALVMAATVSFHPPGYIWDGALTRTHRDLDGGEARAWRDALAALAADADAPLPTIEPPGDAPTAA